MIKATKEYDFKKDQAYQIGKDEKGYQIRVDANGRWIAIKDDKVVHASFEITGQEIRCTIPEEANGTTILIRKNPEAKPLEEVLGTEIQIYNNPELRTKIGESLFYTRPELKEIIDGRWIFEDYDSGKKAPIPIAAMLRDCVRDRLKTGKTPSLNQLLQTVNELRDGTLEEQAIYGMFREHLIENGFMPVDRRGQPYDLSLYFIPNTFNMPAFFNDLAGNRSELSKTIAKFYREKYKSKDSNQKHLHACLNAMKTEMPSVFMEMHNYLVEKEYIPASPILAELNLKDEKLKFLLKPALQDVMTPIFDWVRKNKKSIEEMRFGTLEEQETYYKLCTLIKNIPEQPEKPSYPERRRAMFDQARQHSKAKLESRV